MTQTNFKLKDLRRIINEELTFLKEQVDHAAIKDIVTGAQKLLASIEAFKKTAPPSALNACTPHVDQLEKVLEDMLSTPGSYVQKPKVEPKKVSLKPVKDTD
jgi:chemotaxis regulatin CheY-phosphate phosphatase CheZ